MAYYIPTSHNHQNYSVYLTPIILYTYHKALHQELIIAAWSISSDLDPDPYVVKYVK